MHFYLYFANCQSVPSFISPESHSGFEKMHYMRPSALSSKMLWQKWQNWQKVDFPK
jgi:hypothetical protein